MKKLIALLLALTMVLALAACGGDKPNETNPAPSNDKPSNPSSNTQPTIPVNGETLDTNLWSLTYDPDVWTYEEDDLYDDEDYSEIIMIIPDGEDSYTINVEIQVSVDDAESFRSYLSSYDFDAYEYAVNNAYDLVNVGGVDCLVQEGNYWGDPCLRYIGRDEAASVTVFIEILGDYESDQVTALLSTLSIKAEDIGNEDWPWAWEGEPFAAADYSEMVGTIRVDSQWLPIEDCIVTEETFDHAVAVVDDMIYILGDGYLRQYAFDGSSLVLEAELELSEDYDTLQSTEDGTLWVSGFMEPMLTFQDGVQTGSYDGPDSVSMHPSGEWGISWFSGPECEKISVDGNVLSTSDITFDAVSTISTLVIDEDYIYVCGYAADDSGHKVFLYDFDGNLVLTLTDADGDALGSISYIAQTADGFIGLDGNMRDLVLWTADGEYIGSISDGDIFGTYYPWFCGGALCADGSILVIMTEDRADNSAMELVAFLLSGF